MNTEEVMAKRRARRGLAIWVTAIAVGLGAAGGFALWSNQHDAEHHRDEVNEYVCALRGCDD